MKNLSQLPLILYTMTAIQSQESACAIVMKEDIRLKFNRFYPTARNHASDDYILTHRIVGWSLRVKKEKEFTQVSIPTTLFKKLGSRIEGTSFHSVSDYVTYVLEDILRETEKSPPKESFSESDEERVKDRLRALGYI